jgi:outer membrane protein assembly factor BamD (BamD/ComL family)
MRSRTLQRLLGAALLATAGTLARAGEQDPLEQIFDRSIALYEAKSYAVAREGFEAYREGIQDREPPTSPRLAEAIFYEAECRYFEGEKDGAHDLYRTILDEHKNSPHLAEVINREYQIGSAFIEGQAARSFLFLIQMKSESLGVEILERLVAEYQQKYFDYAHYQIAAYYFLEHDWRRAADAYFTLEQQFPESPWAGVAQYQRALCWLRLSRGYRYDPTPVAKAEEILLDYVKRNPTGSRIREAERALDEIRADRALLYLENARFYLHRERRPRAALVYLEAMLRDTPEAPAAQAVPDLLDKVAERAEERDPATAGVARELLAELERRRGAPAPPASVPAPTPGRLVPGGRGGGGGGK